MKQRDAQHVPAALQWTDGLLLEPQHFQESTRRSERLLDYHLARVAPFHYGVVSCAIEASLPTSGTLRVSHLEAVMPDGLVIYHDAAHPFPDRVGTPRLEAEIKASCAAFFTRGSSAIVYLSVAPEGSKERYDRPAGATAEAEDEIGDDPLAGVARLVPKLTLVVGEGPPVEPVAGLARTQRTDERPPGLVNALPLFQINQGTNMLECVPYEPPLLRVVDGSPLYRLCREEILEKLRLKAGRLAATAMALSLSNDNERHRRLQCERQVQSLVGGIPPVEALLDTGAAHPFAVYLAMAALVGQIAAASQELIPPAPSTHYPYDHEDVLFTFRRIRDHVGAVCDGILESFAALRLTYNAARSRYQVDLPSFWNNQVLGLAVRDRTSARNVASDLSKARIVVERDQRQEVDATKRTIGATRFPRGDTRIPTAVNERLSEIALTNGGYVYWVDSGSPDLQQGTGPFLVDAPGDADNYEVTLYVSYPPKTEK